MSPWIQLLEDRILKRADKVPKEFLRSKDLAKVWGLSRIQTQRRLRDFIKHKEVEMKVFTICDAKGKLNHAQHYRVITKGKA